MRRTPLNAMLVSGFLLTGYLNAAADSPVSKADSDNIKAAVTSPDRPSEDVKRDKSRHPYEVLSFAGLEPGMHVLDMNSGGGYFSEILSRSVGDGGKVWAHNDPLYHSFFKDALPVRYTDRLSNVQQIQLKSEDLNFDEASLDAAFLFLAYHDFYFISGQRSEPVDVKGAMSNVYKALKPGGYILITDHVGIAGTGPELGHSLHRIDPAHIKNMMAKVGFELSATSDILANPEDDHTTSPFAPEIRGKTDRVVFKFSKPE